jgi:hypothetical protein
MFEYPEATMKKTLLICGALLALTASMAFAQYGGGVNLSWTDCNAFGEMDRTFACNTNTTNPPHNMIGSFIPPSRGCTKLTGNEMILHVLGSSPTLVPWWQFKNTGTCRQTALSVLFSGFPYNCENYWAGQASGSIAAYVFPWTSPADARIKLVAAVGASVAGPVYGGVEYYSFLLQMSNAKTVGTPSCAGCQDPVCIVLDSINLTQPVGVGNYFMYMPAPRSHITWQGGPSNCPGGTPTKAATWGSLKSLYR